MSQFALSDLEQIIAVRSAAPIEESWTARLVSGGQKKAAQKLGEEAVEAAIAAVDGDRSGLVSEAADVLYHLLVVLKIADIPLNDVMSELEARTARSGIEEKADRKQP
ncbi:MAG: phosphoribosyl-ATP diphosphatase [Pseudomonadota bacterium]